ncbi:hypothetical protein HN011_010856 [Eciton burchellii]|nr:hypothetical protein HN011_010856 [Eciton burchellii]
MKRKQQKCACNKFQKQHKRRTIHKQDISIPRVNFHKNFYDSRKQLKPDKGISVKRTVRLGRKKRCIADYPKVIRNGSKQAKCYIKEALLYGLQSGLLIPLNRNLRLTKMR